MQRRRQPTRYGAGRSARGAGRRCRRQLSRLLFRLLLGAILLYILFPFYWALRSALSPDIDLFATPVQYFPTHPTLSNFQIVLSDWSFLHALLNSALVATWVTALALLIGTTAAYALGRLPFRGRAAMRYLVLSLTMFPQIAVLGALWNMVVQLGLYDRLAALVLTDLITTVPLAVWILMVFFRSLPMDLEEAAYVDGATPFQAFRRIMAPLVAPGLVTAGLLTFIAAWNEFLLAVSFVQSPESRTVPVAMSYISTWGQVMAATVIATIPLITLTLVFQRRIIAGLTGAVNG